jgi:DNA-binding SARP family transcriptional activator
MAEDDGVSARGWQGVAESFPYGLLLADEKGCLLEGNERAVDLLGTAVGLATLGDASEPSTCCELFCAHAPATAFGGGCLTDFALRTKSRGPEIRIDLASGEAPTAAWISAFTVDPERSLVLFQLRPGSAFDRRRVEGLDLSSFPALRIDALGGFRVQGPEGPVGGGWLGQRPGLLLKYLVTERSGVVPSEQIAEALWPGTAQRDAVGLVRQYVHQLRGHLEPGRASGEPSLYLVTRKGGYALEGVWIDVDEFEHRVDVGLRAFAHGHDESARKWLIEGREFYSGDFLSTDAYFEWARPERDRLRELAARMTRALVELELRRGAREVALTYASDLAEMEPFDGDVQRELLRLCMLMGKHGEAVRRYELYRNRLRRHFGGEPDFTLSELTA